ncbi:MAG: hypothetical protein V1914_00495 [archaeon]
MAWNRDKLFVISLISVIVFLLVELTIRIYNLYKELPLVDVPSHLFAGIALGIGIYWILNIEHIPKRQGLTMTFTLAGALIWEVLETLEELVVENPPYLQDIFFWDGFFDIVVTVLGGSLGLLILYLISKKTKILHPAKCKNCGL